jgi:hypothetical protein
MAAFELEANIGRQPYAGDLPFYLKQALEGAAVALVFREGGIPRPKDNALTPRSMLKTTRLASPLRASDGLRVGKRLQGNIIVMDAGNDLQRKTNRLRP